MVWARRSLIAASLGAAACGAVGVGRRRQTLDVYVLLDVSGSYIEKARRSVDSIGRMLLSLRAGDTVTVATIQTCSFSEEAVLLNWTLPDDENVMNPLKVSMRDALRRQMLAMSGTDYTDIRGAMLVAAQSLERSDSVLKFLVTMSDLREEPSPSCRTPDNDGIHLTGVDVIYTGVPRDAGDQFDPDGHQRRLDRWTDWARERGATSAEVVNRMNDAVETIQASRS